MKKNNKYESDVSRVVALSEPMASYQSSTDIISAIRAGISREEVLAFCRRIRRSLTALAKVLPASYSLLTKRDVYDAQVGERVMQIAMVYEAGLAVFGEVERFNAWLDTPAPQLEGQRPFELLDTGYGINLVKQWIHRIDHGLPA